MNLKKLLPIILIVVLLVAAGLVYYFVFYEAPVEYSYYTPGDYFVVNVKETNRLFKLGAVLVVDTKDADFLADLKEQQAGARDAIIFILTTIDEAQWRDPETPVWLRDAIKNVLNERFETEHFVDVYFTEYVMQ